MTPWPVIEIVAVAAGAALMAQEGAPRYKVDADWPKRPLPNRWFLGGITGLDVDRHDNVWVLNRPADLDETENTRLHG